METNTPSALEAHGGYEYEFAADDSGCAAEFFECPVFAGFLDSPESAGSPDFFKRPIF